MIQEFVEILHPGPGSRFRSNALGVIACFDTLATIIEVYIIQLLALLTASFECIPHLMCFRTTLHSNTLEKLYKMHSLKPLHGRILLENTAE